MMPLAPLNSWLDAALGFVYPNVCQICSAESAAAAEGYVCVTCRNQPRGVKPVVPPFCEKCGVPFYGDSYVQFSCGNCAELELRFDHARAAVELTDFVREVIHRYKYNQAIWFERFLAPLLIDAALPALQGGGWDMVIPVPLHPVKERERQFNQATRLAKALAKALELPTRCDILERVEATSTQTALTRRQRAENVKRAFAIKQGKALTGARIILVDDVMTTGSTCSACAAALKDQGAAAVAVWTVARGRLL